KYEKFSVAWLILTGAEVEVTVLDIICVFLKSRSRHTRLVSDWSSDVCSSDLRTPSAARRRSLRTWREWLGCQLRRRLRSEERRVGEEWRSRWSPLSLKK